MNWKEEIRKGLSKNYEICMYWFCDHIKIEITHYKKTLFFYYEGHDELNSGHKEVIRLKEIHNRIDDLMDRPDMIFVNGDEI